MKISIIVHSETGNTEQIAREIIHGLTDIPNTEVKCFNIIDEDNWDKDFIYESKAVLFGTPTYYANLSWQL